MIDEDMAKRMFTLPASTASLDEGPHGPIRVFEDQINRQRHTIEGAISLRNAQYYQVEAAKLDGWADDIKLGLERDIKEIDRQIKEARRAATLALTLEEKLSGQKQLKSLESLRNQKRRSLFDAQDEVDRQRERLITQIEGKLEQKSNLQPLFTIGWRLV